MKPSWKLWTTAALVFLFTLEPRSIGAGGPADWDSLQRGGLVVLIRHTAAPGFGDPPHFRIGDCSTQRNLSAEGRRQARELGEAFRRRKIPIENVYSSQWCRCKDTAELAFGSFLEHPALNSFFEHPALKASRTEALKALLRQVRPDSGNLVLVTHQVNITALTGVVPAEGELVVVRDEPDGRLRLLGRMTASD